jgi:dipeptide/tripeptide permease
VDLHVFLISVNEGCERVMNLAVSANIIIYLTKEYHMGSAESAIVVFAYQAATNFLPIFGAIVSDALLGRFLTILLTLLACTIVRYIYLYMYRPFSLTEVSFIINVFYFVLVSKLGSCSSLADHSSSNIGRRRLC